MTVEKSNQNSLELTKQKAEIISLLLDLEKKLYPKYQKGKKVYDIELPMDVRRAIEALDNMIGHIDSEKFEKLRTVDIEFIRKNLEEWNNLSAEDLSGQISTFTRNIEWIDIFIIQEGLKTAVKAKSDVPNGRYSIEKAEYLKIKVMWNTEVVEFLGEQKVNALKLKNNADNSQKVENFGGVFIAIGYEPQTSLFTNQIDLDEKGYIKPTDGKVLTNKKGVFVCGDVEDHIYRQAVVAAGAGCMAALEAEKYLI